MDIYTCECLVNNITSLGAPCKSCGYSLTPNTVLYDFDLLNIKNLGKIKNIVKWLSAYLHEPITQKTSPKAHFRLEFIREERELIPFWYAYNKAELKPLEFVIGQGENGEFIKMSVADMISALCVGTSGSGKSTFLHTFINSLCCSSDNVGFVMIDCKQSELMRYNGTNHIMCDVATTPRAANYRLRQIIDIMYKRYDEMKQKGINKITDEYNHIVIIVDELAELMLSADKDEAEDTRNMLIRLCQLGRACGIHCLLCTQSPRVAVVDGLIQANTPTKFAFRTSNTRESIIAIGHGGCEKLFGSGDMIFKRPDSVTEYRVQAPYITTEQIDKIHHKKEN